MNNLINPYDLDIFNSVGERDIFRINDFIKQAQKEFKLTLIKSQIEALGIKIELSSTKTRFGGKRLWFVCPSCHRRVGNLYRGIGGAQIGCRKCLELKYDKQKYKSVS